MTRHFPATVPTPPPAPSVVPQSSPCRDGGLERVVTADASKVSGADFFAIATDVLFPPRPVNRTSEAADATHRYLDAVWGKPSDEARVLYDAYIAELAEIDARYAAIEADLRSEIVL
jgi:hypothetical protein